MPLLTPERSPIARLRVVDRVQDDTTICQVATMRGFHCVQTETGVLSVTIDVWVTKHSSRGGEPGDVLAGSHGRALHFSGDNLTLVEADTGAELAIRTTETTEQWQAITDSFPQNTLLQGDFFLALLRQPVDIAGLILYHMERANSPALNRYA